MQIPTFHDGTFDGFKIGPGKQIQLYLTSVENKAYVLELEEVQAMSLTGVKQGNIILDLVLRRGHELKLSDIHVLYGVSDNPVGAKDLLASAVQKGFLLLEINPSYGVEGLILFRDWKLRAQVE